MLLVKSENTVLQIYHHMFTNMTPRGHLSHTNQYKTIQNYGPVSHFLIVFYYCQSCIRGKAITAPKTENMTRTIQKGTAFFWFFSRRASATGCALLATTGACWTAGDGAGAAGFSRGSSSAAVFSNCCCWLYFSTYSGNSFLKCGQFLLQREALILVSR
jgi:hypothetical protein